MVFRVREIQVEVLTTLFCDLGQAFNSSLSKSPLSAIWGSDLEYLP